MAEQKVSGSSQLDCKEFIIKSGKMILQIRQRHFNIGPNKENLTSYNIEWLNEFTFLAKDYATFDNTGPGSIFTYDAGGIKDNGGTGGPIILWERNVKGVDSMWTPVTPKQIVFHVTGFGKFSGVKDNPTTYLMDNLSKWTSDNKDIPSNVVVTTDVLTVSGEDSVKELKKIRESNDKSATDTAYVYLHFGVASGRINFSLEAVAYNCANFKSPDESGWEPENEMILKDTGNIDHTYHTTLPVDALQAILAKQYGYKVKKSTDPGRYVCNWIYYNSLYLSLNRYNEYTMFIHVPMFDEINQDTQFRFARDFIIETAKLLNDN